MDQNNAIIYTDGGCYNNGDRKGDGSYAYLFLDEDNTEYVDVFAQYINDTTNNRMEMIAAINAIMHSSAHDCTVISDSIYLVKGFSDPSYLERWISNGWKTSTKKSVQNIDLWQMLSKLSWHRGINFIHIRGHNKDKNSKHAFWNDICDKACTFMLEQKQPGFLFTLRYYFNKKKFEIVGIKLIDKED